MVHSISVSQMNPSFNEQNFNSKMNDINHLKSNLRLDLHVGNNNRRRNKFGSPAMENYILSSPDFTKCGLRSPDIAKMLLESGTTLQTPTPNTMRSIFQKPSEDIELFETFGSTLTDLPAENDHSLNGVSKSNSISMNNINYDNTYPTSISTSFGLMPDNIKIKEEPQTVPSRGSSSPISPINMDDQEKIKKDRKKERNRKAAAKCRKKKLEKISQLEGKVKQLTQENSELSSVARRLKEEVATLQIKIMKHHRSGCAIIIPS